MGLLVYNSFEAYLNVLKMINTVVTREKSW